MKYNKFLQCRLGFNSLLDSGLEVIRVTITFLEGIVILGSLTLIRPNWTDNFLKVMIKVKFQKKMLNRKTN